MRESKEIIQGKKITILKEFKEFVTPLTDEEFQLLEKSILLDGCLESLVVWEKNGKFLLVDGHNRFKICSKNNIPFKVRKTQFQSMDDAKLWMVDNQIGRRNLNDDQLSYYRGLKYLALKKRKGGFQNVTKKGNSEQSTSDQLADIFKISGSTIKRDAKFAEGINIIARTNPKLRAKILIGTVKVKKADVQILTEAKNPERLQIKNEADLYNKAKQLRESLLDEVEAKVKEATQNRLNEAKLLFAEREPIFQDKNDRTRKIKGMIISAINEAIEKRDRNAITTLRQLIDKLTDEIFN